MVFPLLSADLGSGRTPLINVSEECGRFRAMKLRIPGGDKDDLAIARQKVDWLLIPK